MNKVEKTSRMPLQQREAMLSFMKEHENFATGRILNLGSEGVKVKARLLQNLADELNSLPNGATKSGDKWMKSWQDWRSDVKAKAAKFKRSLNGTGGGPPTKLTLTPLEEELMAFLGQVVAEGLSTVADPIESEASLRASAMDNMVWEEVGEAVHIPLDAVASVSVFHVTPLLLNQSYHPRSQMQQLRICLKKGRKGSTLVQISEGSSAPEVPDKLLQLSEEQNQLLKRKIELRGNGGNPTPMSGHSRTTAAINNVAIAITDTMTMLQGAIKMWLEQK